MAAIFQIRLRAARGVARLTLWFAVFDEVMMNAPAAHWDILKQDLRYTARTLNRARGFALTAILVTALGVGANTAAFSVADFVLLRPLPFADPDALVRAVRGTAHRWRLGLQQPDLAGELSRLQGDELVVRGDRRVHGQRRESGGRRGTSATRDHIGDTGRDSALGVSPALGRVFDAARDDRGAAIISYGLWQSQFGGRPRCLAGRSTSTACHYTVIGVMPPRLLLSDPRCSALDR